MDSGYGDIFNDKYGLLPPKYDAYGLKQDYRHHCKEAAHYDRIRNYNISKSTLRPVYKTACSKTTVSSAHHKTNPTFNKDVSSLPYYIVPVLYVPHKPLYNAKEMVPPTVYQAYHCKSKKQLKDGYKSHISKSKSLLDIYGKRERKNDDYYKHIPNSVRERKEYNFENYDHYFKKYIDNKQSQSDISFYSEKSFSNVSLSPRKSNDNMLNLKYKEKNYEYIPEKPRHYSSEDRICELLKQSSQLIAEKPTWDSPRTNSVSVGIETSVTNTLVQTVKPSVKDNYNQWFSSIDTQSTQTILQDIKTLIGLVEEKTEKSEMPSGDAGMMPKSINEAKIRPVSQVSNRSRFTKSILPTYRGIARKNTASKKSTTSMM